MINDYDIALNCYKDAVEKKEAYTLAMTSLKLQLNDLTSEEFKRFGIQAGYL